MRILGFEEHEQPDIGDVFIIHKPRDIYEHPRWISSMDKYDCTAIKVEHRSIYSNVWYAENIDCKEGSEDWAVNAKWLEKVNYEDLEESTVDFSNI